MNSVLIISHANCSDGFTAAWIAKHYFEQMGKTVDIELCNYNENYDCLRPKISGNDVYVFDFSFPRDLMVEFHSIANRFEVFDHHKSAAEACKDLPFCLFDMSKSGAMLAWERLRPDEAPIKLVQYVQDYDLWQWELPYSKEINAVIQSTERTYENWYNLARELENENSFPFEASKGMTILNLEQAHIRKAIEDPVFVTIGGHRVPLINNPNLVDKTLNVLSKSWPFAAAFFMIQDGRFKFSLRSSRPNGIDVSEVAKQYGGGGHAAAASFKLNLEQFNDLHKSISTKDNTI